MIPVAYRPDDPSSLYSRLVASASGPQLPVGLNLTGACDGSISGSVKLDCYTWAVARWLAPNSTRPADGLVHGYFIDYYWTTKAHVQPPGPNSDNVKSTVTNHDFVVSRGGFFWDLSPWDDETPVDDPDQPLGSDLKALRMILDASNKQADARISRAEQSAASLVQSSLDAGAPNSTASTDSAPADVKATTVQPFVHVSGFVPWYMKYVAPNGKHQGVATEWQTMLVATSYNTFVDADACCIGDMANAAFFQHYPGPDPQHRFMPPKTPQPQDLVDRGLLKVKAKGRATRASQLGGARLGSAEADEHQRQDGLHLPASGSKHLLDGIEVAPGKLFYFFYAGDFDSAAWLYSQLYSRWNDPARGSVPIAWPLDPALAVRFPPAFDLVFSDLQGPVSDCLTDSTCNDTIITGDSGAGYISPPQLQADKRAAWSGYPDGRDRWVDFAGPLYRRNGATYTGFLISGSAGAMTPKSEEPYTRLAPHGMADQGYPSIHPHLAEGRSPVVPQSDIHGDPASAAKDGVIPLLP